jgi:hypothetical protein
VINEIASSRARLSGNTATRTWKSFPGYLDGALAHKDSIGTGAIIVTWRDAAHDCGHRIAHSEFNNSSKEPCALSANLDSAGDVGSGSQATSNAAFSAKLDGNLFLVASADGRDGSVLIHQDVDLYVARFAADADLTISSDRTHRLAAGGARECRTGWTVPRARRWRRDRRSVEYQDRSTGGCGGAAVRHGGRNGALIHLSSDYPD